MQLETIADGNICFIACCEFGRKDGRLGFIIVVIYASHMPSNVHKVLLCYAYFYI